jgi:SAM-dependent methyltransferase
VAQYLLNQKKRYVGIDISEQQIEMARKDYPSGKFLVSDMVAYLERVPDESYDGVIALFSIFHVPRTLHTHIFQRILCALKPGGYFLMNTGSHAHEGIENDWLGADAMYWSLMSPKWYKMTLSDLGFEKIVHKLDTKEFQGEAETTYYYLARRPSNNKE